jgi:hypothetical protein
VTIEWNDEEGYTCGWLLSELIRRTTATYNNARIVSLRSKKGQHITLDFYLTQVDKYLALLQPNEELEAIEIPEECFTLDQ